MFHRIDLCKQNSIKKQLIKTMYCFLFQSMYFCILHKKYSDKKKIDNWLIQKIFERETGRIYSFP